MKYKIHAEKEVAGREVESTFVVEGQSVEEIQEKANAGLRERGLMDAEVWSEQIS